MKTIKDNYKKIKISWEDLEVGDIFLDGSEVEQIAPWEYRSCYELSSDNGSLIVSDEHLISCKFYDGDNEVPYYENIVEPKDGKLNVKELYGWATAEHIYQNFPDFQIELNPGVWLKSIKLYDEGNPQKVRCIKTNTGQYAIGDFINHNTTTLAACINDFTQNDEVLDNKMIITLEDPCEYIYKSTESTKINQKELGKDFKSFSSGIKQSLREHPNMILCGEIRDKEVINTTIEAARTGHLVATTIHSDSVAGTISRIAYYLQDSGEDMIYDLILNLNFILSQRIKANGAKFILETQYLFFTEDIVKYLLNTIDEKRNISRSVNALFKNEKLLESGILKDWS